jgi:hypothetical protein
MNPQISKHRVDSPAPMRQFHSRERDHGEEFGAQHAGAGRAETASAKAIDARATSRRPAKALKACCRYGHRLEGNGKADCGDDRHR